MLMTIAKWNDQSYLNMNTIYIYIYIFELLTRLFGTQFVGDHCPPSRISPFVDDDRMFDSSMISCLAAISRANRRIEPTE